MKLLIDLTRANPNTETYLFNRAIAMNSGVSGADVTSFRQPHQAPPSFGQEIVLQAGCHYTYVAQAVFDRLRQILSESPDEIRVFSFHKVVFELHLRLTPQDGARVAIKSFKSLWQDPAAQPGTTLQASVSSSAAPGAIASAPTQSAQLSAPIQFHWPNEFMPLQEAIDILKSLLHEVSATDPSRGIRQTDVRNYLARADLRFAKSNPPASVPGLISGLIRAAEQGGDIRVDRYDFANPRIWMPAASDAEVGGPVRVSSRPSTRQRSRSQEFLDVLRSQKLGPFSNIRRLVYDALEEKLAIGPTTVSELLKQTIDRARAKAEDLKFDTGRYPWRHVREFLTELLTRRPVLLASDNSEVVPSFGSLNMKVVSLCPDWRLKLDGALVVALAGGGVDIRLVDVPALAGALYHERSDQTEAETAEIISHLMSTGHLIESTDGTHKLQMP